MSASASTLTHTHLLERPAVFDLTFDYKSGTTREGWTLENIKAGSLPALTAYLGFYVARSRRPALVGVDPRRLGYDPDFVPIFCSMYPIFAPVKDVFDILAQTGRRAVESGDAIAFIQVADALSVLLHPEQRYFLRLTTAGQQDAVAGSLDVLGVLDDGVRRLSGPLRDIAVDALAGAQEAMRLCELALSLVCERGATVTATETDTLTALNRALLPETPSSAGAMPPPLRIDLKTTYPGIWSTPYDVLACQWTYIEAQLFRAIPMAEWLDCGWDKPRYEHAADFIRRAIDQFNATALWVTAEVLSHDRAEDRAAAIVRFIKVAVILRQYNNFPALVEISLGLRREAVSRLKRTWELVPAVAKDKLTAILAVTDDAKNYQAYKAALRGVPKGTPIVPHLGAHTAEITMRDQLVPATIKAPSGVELIHFRRHRELYEMTMTLVDMQQADFEHALPFPRMPAVVNMINAALRPFYFVFDDDRDSAVSNLEQRSAALEPPERPAATAASH